MLGFLCPSKELKGKITKDKIYFVSVPDNSTDEEKKVLCASKARLFAEKLNINEVFLHFGKEKILNYEFKV